MRAWHLAQQSQKYLSYAGSLPENAQQLLRDISDGRSNWLGAEFTSTRSLHPLMHFTLIAGLRISGSINPWNFYWGIAYDPTRA